jgi:hypothetical protein
MTITMDLSEDELDLMKNALEHAIIFHDKQISKLLEILKDDKYMIEQNKEMLTGYRELHKRVTRLLDKMRV